MSYKLLHFASGMITSNVGLIVLDRPLRHIITDLCTRSLRQTSLANTSHPIIAESTDSIQWTLSTLVQCTLAVSFLLISSATSKVSLDLCPMQIRMYVLLGDAYALANAEEAEKIRPPGIRLRKSESAMTKSQ